MKPLIDHLEAWQSARDVALARWKGKTEGIMQRAPAVADPIRDMRRRSDGDQLEMQTDVAFLKRRVELLKTECDLLRELHEADADVILAIVRQVSVTS